MKKIEPLRYTAQVGEEIDIVVTPTGTAPLVAASLDGHTFSPISGVGTAPRYKFIVNRPQGRTHFVEMEFSFPQAGPGAKYDVALSGSNGGSDDFSVGRDDAIKDQFMRFRVVA
jgi:hypothetical protein